MFDLAIDSKLRCYDLVKLRISEVVAADTACHHAIVVQQKTHKPVQFELTEQIRDSLVFRQGSSSETGQSWLPLARCYQSNSAVVEPMPESRGQTAR